MSYSYFKIVVKAYVCVYKKMLSHVTGESVAARDVRCCAVNDELDIHFRASKYINNWIIINVSIVCLLYGILWIISL